MRAESITSVPENAGVIEMAKGDSLEMVRHPDGEVARVVPPPPGVYEGAWIGMFVSFSAYGNRFRVKMSETSIDGMRECTVTVSQGVIRRGHREIEPVE